MEWLRSLFGFTRAQVNGFVVLLPLLLLIIFSEPLYRNFFMPPPQPPATVFPYNPVVSLSVQDSLPSIIPPSESANLAQINPNDATFKDWLSLGVSQEVAARILAYRKKGGKFFYKTDLLKIYGFDSAVYRRVAAHLKLPERSEKSDLASGKASGVKSDLNLADSLQLIRVYGVGAVLARRIIRYRDALGGFVAWHQLYSVYGLDTAAVENIQRRFFIAENFTPRKVNINVASEQELAAHPLISHSLADAIIRYRMQHGNYKHVEDIRKIVTVKEQDFESVKPYLTVD